MKPSVKYTTRCHKTRFPLKDECEGCSGYDYKCPKYKTLQATHYNIPKDIQIDYENSLLLEQNERN